MMSSGWLLEWLGRYFGPAGYHDAVFHQCAAMMESDKEEEPKEQIAARDRLAGPRKKAPRRLH